jgi:hypothetical protein
VTHTGVLNSLPWAAVHWLFVGGSTTITQADLTSAAAFVGNAYGANVIVHMSAVVIAQHTHLALYGDSGDLLEADASYSLAGGATGVCTPANCCLCVTWHVATGYRGGHPRTYVPGVPDSAMITSNDVTGTFASSLAAGANTYRTNVNGYTNTSMPSVTLGTMSFVRANAWRTPPVFIPFTSASCDVRLDTQRRRLGPDIAG